MEHNKDIEHVGDEDLEGKEPPIVFMRRLMEPVIVQDDQKNIADVPDEFVNYRGVLENDEDKQKI